MKCCGSIVRGYHVYKDDDLDNDGIEFHQQYQQWFELLGNNFGINFHGLKDHKNHENLYATKIYMLAVVK